MSLLDNRSAGSESIDAWRRRMIRQRRRELGGVVGPLLIFIGAVLIFAGLILG